MGLIHCPECRKKISEYAKACPICAYPINPDPAPAPPPPESVSASNVLCGLVSFFFPGLGQLFQGRIVAAVVLFFTTILAWVITAFLLGWVMNIYAAWDAATYREPAPPKPKEPDRPHHPWDDLNDDDDDEPYPRGKVISEFN